MNKMPLDQLTKVIKDAFNGAAKITKSFQTFFIETMILYLSIPKRINFMQMSHFWSGCAGAAKYGLEIVDIAIL